VCSKRTGSAADAAAAAAAAAHHGQPHAPVAEHRVGQQLGGSTHSDALAVVQLIQPALQQQQQAAAAAAPAGSGTCRKSGINYQLH
jgi:hypothetical protein